MILPQVNSREGTQLHPTTESWIKDLLAAATGTLNVAMRSYPTSEVRNLRPKGGGQEELPHVRGQGQRPRVPGCDCAVPAERRYSTAEVRGGC